jgi:hypothetical protein
LRRRRPYCAIAANGRFHDRRDLGAVEDRATSVGRHDSELSPSQIRIGFLEIMDGRLGRFAMLETLEDLGTETRVGSMLRQDRADICFGPRATAANRNR